MDIFTTCTACAIVIVYGDESMWDDMTPEERSSADAALEAIGLYDDHVVVDGVGYYDCFVCGEINIGSCHEFTGTVN